MRRIGLRVRLVALVAISATAVTTLAALALYRDLSGEVSDAITAELRLRMADLDAEPRADAGASASTQHAVVAQLIDASGRVIVPGGARPLLSRDELAAALEHETLIDRRMAGIGAEVRVLAEPLALSGRGRVVGVTAMSTAPLDHVRDRLVLVLLLATPAMTAAVTLAAWALSGAALRPVRRMARRAEAISGVAAGARLPQPPGDDEIAELGRTLNAMLARIEASITRERAFIDDASHELRTPLAVLRGELELSLGEDDVPSIKRGLRSSLEETDRLARLAENLLTLARADVGQTRTSTPVNLTDAARAAVARLGERPAVAVTVVGPDADVPGPAEWIDQVVTNLLVNARDHANSAVRAEVAPVDAGYRLTVADDGPGFPDDLLPRVFERFTRGDGPRRGGTGLGLAIVAALTHSLGGRVQAGNGPPLGGARVEVTLPRAQPHTPTHAPLTPRPPPSGL